MGADSVVGRAVDLVVIGASWGGLNAISVVLGALPADFPTPIVFVQHRSKDSDGSLVTILQDRCGLPICEVEDKDPVLGNCVYVAPPDYHLLVEGTSFALSIEAPVAFSRPSIDVLFESAADAYGPGVVGVVLTGANADGTRGLRRVKAAGGYAIVQDPATAESRAMPEAAIAGVAVDEVLALDMISPALLRLTGPRAR